MIFVLEGTDGVGKTSLADAIQAARPWSSVKRISCGPPPKNVSALDHYMGLVNELVAADGSDSLAIADRLHVGELCYGPLLRGGSRITLQEAGLIDSKLKTTGAVLVHCTADVDEIVRRLTARDGGKPDPKSGAKVQHTYPLRVAFMWACTILPGGWTTVDMREYPAQIADRLIKIDRAADGSTRRGRIA